ncbi:MAG TPA: LamG-like jellyroll fold domain-containing protein, partial [Planctomycetota bacterium]|nr:LamG-like jellyroll fold domain-containing protein [Planctomycetota bacterium]
FKTQVAPLLAQHCLECHDATSRKGRLDLSRREAAFAGGKAGPAIVPGKAEDSLLWQRIESDEMPVKRPPLPPREKRLLREWIDAGAAWPVEVIDPSDYAPRRRAGENWVRRLTVPEYIETVRSALGVEVERDARRLLPPDLRADGFTNTAYSLNVDLGHVEAYARLARIIVERMDVVKLAAAHASCQETSDACLREVISGIGKWLLRGPLEEREIAGFLAVSAAVALEGGDFAETVGYVVEAMLQSPRFIYCIERQRGDGTARPPGAFELASRLSYILWGGPPDRELIRAADAGELGERGRVEAQVRRMLQDPRAVKRSCRFIHEWLDLDRLEGLRPNPERFPKWDQRLAADMRDETLEFFRHVAWEENRPLTDLLNAKITFATPRLVAHYDLERELSGAGADDREGARLPERVAGGLEALYRFKEGRGGTVRDVCGAGEPMHLAIGDPAAVRWTEAGLVVRSSTLIAGERPPARLIDAVRASGAITLEAWVTPASASQKGPSRILTLSSNALARNFTLGQEGDRFDIRLRTTATSGNGSPSLSSAPGTAGTAPVHIVYTRDASGAAVVYVDGRESGRRQVGGDLSGWDGGFRLALANELSHDRPWLGTLHLVAVYGRALTAGEVRENHAAGAREDGSTLLAGDRDLQALYTFDDGEGDLLRDTSGARGPVDLRSEDTSALEWRPGGLRVDGRALLATTLPPKRLIDAIKKSSAVTLEAWITPGDVSQSGPARILTLSSGTGERNFTLGQDGDRFDVRLRSTKADGNGMPSLASPRGQVKTRQTHVVYTRDAAGKATLYVDGKEQASREVAGDFSNWKDDFRLALGNETTRDRGWRGTFHRVSVYSRALTPDEVRSRVEVLSPYDLAPAPARGGLLTQGSVLTVGGDEASMVTRGLFVLQELLDDRVGNPPPCVDTTPVPVKPGLSQRAIAEARIADPSCGGCHSRFEPLAFGLERFDGTGAYHEADEHGNKLRDDGSVLFPGEDQPVAYQSSAELMDLLARSDRVRRTLTRKVAQFALGRPLVEADEPILERIHESARKGGGTYAGLITAIVMSDLVQITRTETTE